MPERGHILGIEGTAWNLSAALFGEDLIALYSSPYLPPHGGIHPREAAQHHASAMKEVIEKVLVRPEEIAGIAFSRGPGLGPCLRTVATAARALAIALDVPLIGVNHCIAHIEIGRWATGCDDPIVLYASGANTQVLGYLRSRYRIFGETLDIGIGNALDKFARSRGLSHPGGPAIERLAAAGTPIPLPYTVKGMDLAFSGLVSAAKDSPAELENVCAGLQETAFAMCVEVTERALAHAGKEEVLLVGGVGANRRLQEMLTLMCEDRGATCYVPENRYLGDNGAMIAYTGRIMLNAGDTIPIDQSPVIPGYRSDDVEVTWRADIGDLSYYQADVLLDGRAQGAEAVVEISGDHVVKTRYSKGYRVPDLDKRLIAERTRTETRLISMARRSGVPTPIISDVTEDSIVMERIYGVLLKHVLTKRHVETAGKVVGRLHAAGITHGDLTTSNIMVRDSQCVLIDFGLASVSSELEARGVDIHVFFQTLKSTSPAAADLRASFIAGYREEFFAAEDVLKREGEIEKRGRYL